MLPMARGRPDRIGVGIGKQLLQPLRVLVVKGRAELFGARFLLVEGLDMVARLFPEGFMEFAQQVID